MVAKKFQLDELQKFAEVSGDYNPIHINELEARRLLSGKPIVHGAYLVLWVLDNLPIQGGKLKSLKADFNKPVTAGSMVSASISQSGDDFIVKLECEEATVATIKIVIQYNHNDFAIIDALPDKQEPDQLSLDLIKQAHGSTALLLSGEKINSLFPILLSKFQKPEISVILGATRIIGMLCPGMNSLFSVIELNINNVSDSVEDLH